MSFCGVRVKVQWCHSHLVWLAFEGSIPTCACFHSEIFLGLVSVVFFVEMVRDVGGEAKVKMHDL